MVAPAGVVCGATVPHWGEQAAPFCVSVQFAPALVTSFWIVTVKSCVVFIARLAEVGATKTAIAERFIVYAANLLVSATAVAVMVATTLVRTLGGASYWTDVLV